MILQAGTGIAELIALEMSRRVSFCSYNIHVIFSDSYLFTAIWSNAIYHSNLSSIYFFNYMFLTFSLFFFQSKSPLEETRKKIWLTDSKVIPSRIFYDLAKQFIATNKL